MVVLKSMESSIDPVQYKADCNSVQLDQDFYAMFDSEMVGETATCHIPSQKVYGPIVQTLMFQGEPRLQVAAPPQLMIVVSHEWLIPMAGWKLVAESHDEGQSVVKVYTRRKPEIGVLLAQSSHLPCLRQKLFWKAMEDVSSVAKAILSLM